MAREVFVIAIGFDDVGIVEEDPVPPLRGV